MFKKIISTTGLFFCSTLAFADSSPSAFGLPIGGVLPYKIQLCSSNKENPKNICWVNTPRKEDGDLIGAIKYPDFDNLPLWATSADFWIWLKRDGKINELTTSNIKNYHPTTILKSISAKFGKPTRSNSFGTLSNYHWNLKNITIQMSCSSECDVKFISSELERERNNLSKEIEAREAKRPFSP